VEFDVVEARPGIRRLTSVSSTVHQECSAPVACTPSFLIDGIARRGTGQSYGRSLEPEAPRAAHADAYADHGARPVTSATRESPSRGRPRASGGVGWFWTGMLASARAASGGGLLSRPLCNLASLEAPPLATCVAGPTHGALTCRHRDAGAAEGTAPRGGPDVAEPIVFVAGNNILEVTGGHPSYVRAHARAARRAGFEPHLFTLARTGGTVEADFGTVHRSPVRLGIERWPIVRYRNNQLVWRYALLARAVASFVRAHWNVRLVHSFGVFGSVGTMACDLLRSHGIEIVPVMSSYDTATREVTAKVRGLRPAHGMFQRLIHEAELGWIRQVVARYERRGYLGSRLVLVNYESVRRLLATTYGIGDKIRKLTYSSEVAFRRPPQRSSPSPAVAEGLPPGEAPLVVSVSRHDARKGVDVLLHALARLRRAGIRFRACLVGDGTLLLHHRRLATQLGIDDVAALVGQVPDPYPYLERADIFVLPSLEEGSGSISLLEALQAGVAVVASAVDGIPEDVADGVNGLLVPPGDSAALASAIQRLLTDPALRQDMSM
jgi:glycosyltransferase involved in cell wall biosynthesis